MRAFTIALFTTALLSISIVLTGCVRGTVDSKDMMAKRTAVSVLNPTEGNDVYGTVTFTELENGVRVVANLHDLEEGKHGFHIHENGDCSAPDGTSAGGHWNPTGAPHGAPDDPQHHLGDLGNITANEDGNAYMSEVFPFLSFDEPSIIGKGVIVHSGADDLTSQPTGAAGARVACGVIKMQ